MAQTRVRYLLPPSTTDFSGQADALQAASRGRDRVLQVALPPPWARIRSTASVHVAPASRRGKRRRMLAPVASETNLSYRCSLFGESELSESPTTTSEKPRWWEDKLRVRVPRATVAASRGLGGGGAGSSQEGFPCPMEAER